MQKLNFTPWTLEGGNKTKLTVSTRSIRVKKDVEYLPSANCALSLLSCAPFPDR